MNQLIKVTTNENRKEFDYSQLNEFAAHQLKKIEKEINEYRLKVGESIYKTGLLIATENDFLTIVRAGVDELGLHDFDSHEALICVGLYLEREANGK